MNRRDTSSLNWEIALASLTNIIAAFFFPFYQNEAQQSMSLSECKNSSVALPLCGVRLLRFDKHRAGC